MRYYTFTERIKKVIDKLKYHKKTLEILNNNCYITNSNIPNDNGKVYQSKIDDSYVGRVGMEDFLYFLAKYGITEQIQSSKNGSEYSANIGFNPKEQKWYGWSHRAICGFSIGSRIKKGSPAYRPVSREDMKEEMISFWCGTPENKLESIEEIVETCQCCNGRGCDACNNTGKLIFLKIVYSTSKNLRSEFCEPYPCEWGRGEWTAKNLDDAKQMAIDFAEGVS